MIFMATVRPLSTTDFQDRYTGGEATWTTHTGLVHTLDIHIEKQGFSNIYTETPLALPTHTALYETLESVE